MSKVAAWPLVPIAKVLVNEAVSYGIVQPGQDSPNGVPMVRVNDMGPEGIETQAPMRVAPNVSARHSRTVLRGGELLLSVVGTVGLTAVVPGNLAGWNVARAIAVLRPTGTTADWLSLCFQTAGLRHHIDAALNTTVQATLNLRDLKKMTVPLPPDTVQRGVLEVLGALDDKIATNRRQSRLIDDLTQAAHLRARQSIVGERGTFGEVAAIGGGGTPRTGVAEFWDGSVNWATPTDVTGSQTLYLAATKRTLTKVGLAACSSPIYPAGSILMTSRATIGAFAVTQAPMAVNQGFIVVNAHDPVHQWWLFHEMRSRVDEFLSFANGATFLELPRGKFKGLPVILPDTGTAKAFAETVGPLHSRAVAVDSESARLAATRDQLLPLLMSGRITVRDAERAVETAT